MQGDRVAGVDNELIAATPQAQQRHPTIRPVASRPRPVPNRVQRRLDPGGHVYSLLQFVRRMIASVEIGVHVNPSHTYVDTCALALPGLKTPDDPKNPLLTSIAYGCGVPSQVIWMDPYSLPLLGCTICPSSHPAVPGSHVAVPVNVGWRCPGESVAVGSIVSWLIAADALPTSVAVRTIVRIPARQREAFTAFSTLM
jgi:hypothetical protein